MDQILSKKHYRRSFYTTVSLLLLLSIAIRFFVLPHFESKVELSSWQFSALLAENLTISLIITVLIGSFIFWLTPEIVKKSAIEVIDPKEINPLLKKATTESKYWIYKGACGRYTRATTFPKMAEAARNEGIGRDISVYLLNPKNLQLCTEYATYRRSLKSANGSEPWTRKRVQEEVIATAICAMQYKHNEPLLGIKVFFVDHFSAFRLDISDNYVVVTKEDKTASALKADAGTYFYNSYKDDVRLTERQAERLSCCGERAIEGKLSEQDTQEIIKCSKIVSDTTLRELDIKKITNLVNSPEDPY